MKEKLTPANAFTSAELNQLEWLLRSAVREANVSWETPVSGLHKKVIRLLSASGDPVAVSDD